MQSWLLSEPGLFCLRDWQDLGKIGEPGGLSGV